MGAVSSCVLSGTACFFSFNLLINYIQSLQNPVVSGARSSAPLESSVFLEEQCFALRFNPGFCRYLMSYLVLSTLSDQKNGQIVHDLNWKKSLPQFYESFSLTQTFRVQIRPGIILKFISFVKSI
jgi:hypothetical protein